MSCLINVRYINNLNLTVETDWLIKFNFMELNYCLFSIYDCALNLYAISFLSSCVHQYQTCPM